MYTGGLAERCSCADFLSGNIGAGIKPKIDFRVIGVLWICEKHTKNGFPKENIEKRYVVIHIGKCQEYRILHLYTELSTISPNYPGAQKEKYRCFQNVCFVQNDDCI